MVSTSIFTEVDRSKTYQASHTKTLFHERPYRVICIGAGFSGIYMSIRMRMKCSNVSLQIYEKNADVGGTWFENHYPGAACDVPSHIYNYSFEPNPDWSHFYSGSGEIESYIRHCANKYGAYKDIKFSHEVISAIWNEEKGKWELTIKVGQVDVIKDECEMLINAGGFLNAWRWPDIEGLQSFRGKLLHSARWDPQFDLVGKRVALIGSGSSAIQILPEVQKLAAHVDYYARSATWISPPLASSKNGFDAGKESGNPAYSEEQKAMWRRNPAEHLKYRKEIEDEFNRVWDVLITDSDGQRFFRKLCSELMEDRLKGREDLKYLIPDWDVGCRRLTPGLGYLEAMREPNVKVIGSEIQRIVPSGIQSSDGHLSDVDVIVCATGFDVSFKPKFVLRGRNGYELDDRFASDPRGYMSLAFAQMPNYFIFNGPNACIGNGSLLPLVEEEGDYMIKVINKCQQQNVRSLCIKQDVVDEMTEHHDSLMPRTVWSSGCRSWYKNGKVHGRVTGLWPGSALHFRQTIKEPRWEDYEWTYHGSNRFAYLGNGFTNHDVSGEQRSYYLDGREDEFRPFVDTAWKAESSTAA